MVTNIEVIRQNVFSHPRVMVIGVGSDLPLFSKKRKFARFLMFPVTHLCPHQNLSFVPLKNALFPVPQSPWDGLIFIWLIAYSI